MATKEDYEYTAVAGTEDGTNHDGKNEGGKMESFTIESGPTDRKFLYVAACVGNLMAFVSGVTLGWTSPEIPKLKALGNPLSEPLTKSQESWISSLLPVGATVGPFAAGWAADKLGRKNALLLGAIPFILGFLLASFATNSYLFFLVRFFFGLGAGVAFTVLPMYVGEIAEDEVRDSLGSLLQLFVVVGILFSFVVGPYTSIAVFNIACLIAPCTFLVLFYIFIPESPYYLVRSDKTLAAAALKKLRSKPLDAVQGELDGIKNAVDHSLAKKASFMDIFKSKATTKALTISVGVIAFQQLSGVNVILFYAENIFTDAGSTIAPEISTIIVGVVQVLGSALTPLLVEKKGKRFLLTLSALGMALSQGALAVYFYVKSAEHDVSSIALLPVIALVAFIISYCLGFGPLPWAIMGELFPDNIKSAASTASASGCWFLGFILTKYFPLVRDAIGGAGSFGIFAVFCVAAAIFVYKYLPDTSGKSFQEIQDILSGKA